MAERILQAFKDPHVKTEAASGAENLSIYKFNLDINKPMKNSVIH